MYLIGSVVVQRKPYPEHVLPFEAEAMWAMYVEDKTKDALEICAGPKKMWEYYTPTDLTGEWLEEEGFMKKKVSVIRRSQ